MSKIKFRLWMTGKAVRSILLLIYMKKLTFLSNYKSQLNPFIFCVMLFHTCIKLNDDYEFVVFISYCLLHQTLSSS